MTSPSCASSSSIRFARTICWRSLSVYADGTPVVWVQEEPKNMGAWAYMNRELQGLLAGSFHWSCVSRPLSAQPGDGIDEAPRARAGAHHGRRVRKGNLDDGAHAARPRAGGIDPRGDAGRLEARRGRRGRRRRAARRGREREGDAGGAVAGRGRAAEDPAQERARRWRSATSIAEIDQIGAGASAAEGAGAGAVAAAPASTNGGARAGGAVRAEGDGRERAHGRGREGERARRADLEAGRRPHAAGARDAHAAHEIAEITPPPNRGAGAVRGARPRRRGPRSIRARERVVPMSPLRRTVARRLVEAQQTAAILTTFNEVDMTRRASRCASATRSASRRRTASSSASCRSS